MILHNANFEEILNKKHLSRSTKELVKEVVNFLNKFDKAVIQDFYVGITDSPEERLFAKHRVAKESQRCIYVEARTEETAIEAEKMFISMDMNGEKSPSKGKYIYCYYIDGYTRE